MARHSAHQPAALAPSFTRGHQWAGKDGITQRENNLGAPAVAQVMVKSQDEKPVVAKQQGKPGRAPAPSSLAAAAGSSDSWTHSTPWWQKWATSAGLTKVTEDHLVGSRVSYLTLPQIFLRRTKITMHRLVILRGKKKPKESIHKSNDNVIFKASGLVTSQQWQDCLSLNFTFKILKSTHLIRAAIRIK